MGFLEILKVDSVDKYKIQYYIINALQFELINNNNNNQRQKVLRNTGLIEKNA